MKTFVKISSVIFMCSVCTSLFAAQKFIIKYKPTPSQSAFLLAHHGSNEAKELIRIQMMEKLSQEKVDALSQAAGVTATDSYPIFTGAHVIFLSKDLDRKKTEQFIHNVKTDTSVEYIVEDQLLGIR
jgi:hypothetical protein